MKTFSAKRFVFAICVCLILNSNVVSAVVRGFEIIVDIPKGFPVILSNDDVDSLNVCCACR